LVEYMRKRRNSGAHHADELNSYFEMGTEKKASENNANFAMF